MSRIWNCDRRIGRVGVGRFRVMRRRWEVLVFVLLVDFVVKLNILAGFPQLRLNIHERLSGKDPNCLLACQHPLFLPPVHSVPEQTLALS